MGAAEAVHQARSSRREEHIKRLLEPGKIQPVYQPIVRLTDLEPVGYEGLARFPFADGLKHLPPDVTLAAAGDLGLREELEVACWAAMAAAGSPPRGRLLFVNISPDALGHPGLLALAERLPSRLVIEITEQREVQDYGELREQLQPWIARGAAVAIDDTGAGYASLEHVVEMRPDFLKLSRGLVADIDRDPNRQALLRALGAFAREVGAGIVAEGVERPEELSFLREARVDFAQGWLFGKPAAPWPETLPVEDGPAQPAVTESGIRRLGRLERDLAGAGDVGPACSAVVEHLSRQGLLPSVYLEQGGRLRCHAAHGYWTVYDGMPPEAGIIGRAYRSGETTFVSDVHRMPEYMSLVSAVRAEIAVPLQVGPRVVGVVNVESTTPMGDKACREVERTAGLLARRLAEIGRLDRPTPGQRLSRAAARAAAMDDVPGVIAEAAAAAMEVANMESVAVVVRDGQGVPAVAHAAGAFADAYRAMTTDSLATIAGWVDEGTSTRTMGDTAGKGPTCVEVLRRAGAGAMVVVPLAVSGARMGFLALTDRSNMVLDTETTELLELLGVQAAAQLRGLAAVDQLRDRAARDALTGLGHQATFADQLPHRRAAAQSNGRRSAVLLAAVDGFKELNEHRGHAAGDEVLRSVATLLEETTSDAFRLGGAEFALILDVPDVTGAQEVAWDLQEQARCRLETTLSIGVALAEPDETEAELLERAGAALDSVKRRGRDGVAVAPARVAGAPDPGFTARL